MRTIAFPSALVTMFLFGAMDISRGIAAPLMQNDWQLSYAGLGLAFAANSLGYVVGSFLSGFLVDRWGLKRIILIGGCLLLLGLAGFVEAPAFEWVVLGFLVYGFGGGFLEIGVNGVVPALTRDAGKQSSYFNLLHGLYGCGAFGFPAVAIWMLGHGTWRVVFLLIGCALALLLVMVLVCRDSVLDHSAARKVRLQEHTMAKSKLPASIYKNATLYLLLIAITAYVMAEAAVGTWLPTYLVHVRAFSVSTSSLYLSGFYLFFTVGRLSAAWWVPKVGSYRAVLGSSILSVVFLGLAFVRPTWPLLFPLAGAAFAIIFPTIVSIVSQTFSDYSGTVIGFLFTASGLGSMAVNALIGWLSSAYGMSVGFSFVLLFLVLVVVSSALAKVRITPSVVLEQV